MHMTAAFATFLATLAMATPIDDKLQARQKTLTPEEQCMQNCAMGGAAVPACTQACAVLNKRVNIPENPCLEECVQSGGMSPIACQASCVSYHKRQEASPQEQCLQRCAMAGGMSPVCQQTCNILG